MKYICDCDCGGYKTTTANILKYNKLNDCGCVSKEKLNKNRLHPLFSPEDKDLESIPWQRHTAGYAQKGGSNNRRLAHRIVLERVIGRPLVKGELCDHINRDKLDNRRENLRVADKSINSVNRDKRPDNTSGYVGVYKYYPESYREKNWAPSYWFAICRKGFKTFRSRYFKTAEEAHNARVEKLKDYEY